MRLSKRKKTAEIMFETFRVPAVCFSMQAVLSLYVGIRIAQFSFSCIPPPTSVCMYAAGRTTGLVLDCGEGCTTAVPVYEGFAVTSAITRSDVGGMDVTDQLQLLLRRNGISLTTSAEREIVREMKEKMCEVDPRPRMDSTYLPTSPNVTYRLPDGNVLTLSSERSRAAEVLFCPSIIGSEDSGAARACALLSPPSHPLHAGAPEVIMRSVSKCDLEMYWPARVCLRSA
jgi:centractin